MTYYPIAINISGKSALLAGGGKVAQRKVKSLSKAGAKITVVSPQLTSVLLRLHRQKKIKWIKRPVHSSDLRGKDIVIAATSDQIVNKKISFRAKQKKILINVVDQTRFSNFISPAVFRKSGATVTVYTNGRDPLLSRDLKNFLKERWNEFKSYRDRLRKNTA